MAQKYGTASSNMFSGTYVKGLRTLTGEFEQTPFGKKPARESETYRQGVDTLTGMTLKEILKKTETELKGIFAKIVGTATDTSAANVVTSMVNMGRNISNTPYQPGDYNNIYSYNTPKSNVEHSGTIKQEIDIKVDFSDVTMLNPEMKKVAGNTFMRLIEETGFQNKFKENQNKTFNKPNEPTDILTEYERGIPT